MTRKEKLDELCEMVREFGGVTKLTNNGQQCQCKELLVLDVLLRDGDVYTCVNIDHHGQLNVGGYDGKYGWDDAAYKRTDEEIERLYTAVLLMKLNKNGHERWETRTFAKEFLNEVLSIVEKELGGHGEVRTYQNRRWGCVWGEGVMVDTDYDEAQGTFSRTRSISYYVHCQDEPFVILRQESQHDGYITNIPFKGSAKEAADYLLEVYRKISRDDEL